MPRLLNLRSQFRNHIGEEFSNWIVYISTVETIKKKGTVVTFILTVVLKPILVNRIWKTRFCKIVISILKDNNFIY